MSYLLLTGATGLLGRYVLRDLLLANRPVAVLARASVTASAARRVDAILRFWETSHGRAWPRPVVLEGDVDRPDLGLDQAALEWLRRNCTGVIHSAASLNFYAKSRDDNPWTTNLRGAQHVLNVCRRTGVDTLFHVSTAYVCGLRSGVAREDELDVGQTWGNDYELSKVEAEKLVVSADFLRSTTIFRPSIIVGDSKTGYASTYHGFYAPLKLVYELTRTPERFHWSGPVSFQSLLGLSGAERKNLVPVDWVSSVMTRVIGDSALHGGVYHLTHPEPVSSQTIEAALADALIAAPRAVERPSVSRNSGMAEVAADEFFGRNMQTYRAYFRDDPRFDASRTLGAAPDLPCPTMNAKSLTRLALAAIRANFGWPKQIEPPLSFDFAAYLAKQVPPRGSPALDGNERFVNIGIAGSGGGEWRLAFAPDGDSKHGALKYYEPGGQQPAFARCSTTVDVWRKLVDGSLTCESAILAGSMLIECQSNGAADAIDLLQNMARPGAIVPHVEKSSGHRPSDPSLRREPVKTQKPVAQESLASLPSSPCDAHSPLAIVGLACRLPGADSLEEYWDLLRRGGSAIAELPPHRLDRELYFDPRKGTLGKTYSVLGGLIRERPLDQETCPLPDALIRSSDAAHLTLCEVAATACRQAGYDPFQLPSRRVGVYVGHSGGSELPTDLTVGTLAEHAVEQLRELDSFRDLPADEQEQIIRDVVARIRHDKPRRHPVDGPDVEANAAASLIARAFGLSGPQMVFDAACASSLLALSLAGMALRRGTIDAALVGGASYYKAVSLLLFSQARSCSATGSRPFDAEADGLISSEGYVVLMVKTLARAQADGDTIHAVIRGIGISSDGRGRSLWAPRKEGQIEAVRRAYGSGVDPHEVQYIETHATSTQVGDATEIEALSTFFRQRKAGAQKLPIGSVKSNIGHTLETAGLAGLLKVVLAMKAGEIPASIGVRKLNTEVDWAQAPLEVATTPRPWPRTVPNMPRTAAVNAFGIGGLNVHVVLSEASWATTPAAAATPSSPSPAVAADDAVAIIGRGVILPGAKSLTEFWDLLSSGRDATSDVPPDRWNPALGYQPGAPALWRSMARRGGFVRDYAYDWQRHKVPPRQIANANPLQFMLLDAADQAFEESGYKQKAFDRKLTAVVVGTVFGGDFCSQLDMGLRAPELQRYVTGALRDAGHSPARVEQICQHLGAHIARSTPALHDETGSFTSSTLASRLSKTFDLMGGAMAIDSGAASSLTALAAASDLLLTGAAEMVLCAGAQRSMDLASYETLSLLGLLTDQAPRSPFDRDAAGFVPGEGVVVLLLKRLSAARRDGDKVLGIVRGIGVAADSREPALACAAADRQAREFAQVSGPEIESIEAGCGAVRYDAAVAQALTSEYGDTRRAKPLRVGSLVAQVGHLQAALGLASLVKAMLEREHKCLLPNFGLQHSAVDPRRSAIFAPASDRVSLPRECKSSLVAVLTPARSGLAYEAIVECGLPLTANVESADAPPTRTERVEILLPDRATPSSRLFRFGAADANSLLSKVHANLTCAGQLWTDGTAIRFSPADRARLAIIASSAEDFSQKLRLAADGAFDPRRRGALEDQGVLLAVAPVDQKAWTPPRVAFVFPGQGSQYVGMLAEIVKHDRAAAAAAAKADALLAGLGYSSFQSLINDPGLGLDIWTTQIAMLLADEIVAAALTARGVVADRITAHSFGEFPALIAAGVWTLETAMQATRARAQAVSLHQAARGALLSTSATPKTIGALIDARRAAVSITHYNSPQQTVVGGTEAAIDAFAATLRSEGIAAVRIAVPCPYHTPLLAASQPALRQSIGALPLALPRTPILSSVTNRYVSDPAEIRENLVAQLVAPVRYCEQIQRLADEGIRMFIEVGPQQVLTRLNKQILAGRDALTIACDHPQRGLEQLDRVVAMWECYGGEILSQENAVAKSNFAAVSMPPPNKVLAPIAYFDATQARREAMRRGAGRAVEVRSAPTPTPSVALFDATSSRRGRNATLPVNGPVPSHVDTMHRPPATAALFTEPASPAIRTNGVTPHAVDMPQIAPVASASSSSALNPSAKDPADLEAFLVNFVVEQTGYPPEIVRLEADLEADLGIDSIKKAQLFGELREHFDLRDIGSVKLADFATLQHISAFLLSRGALKNPLPESRVAAAPSAEAFAEMTSDPFATSLVMAPLATSHVSQPIQALPVETAPSERSQAHAEFTTDRLEALLVDFVVEQTGYPPEVVRLEADLEADLGIDSIKKAQLFGELREQLSLAPRAGLKLTDFPTLQHILDYLVAQVGSSAPSSSAGSQSHSSATIPVPQPSDSSFAVAPTTPATGSANSWSNAHGAWNARATDFTAEQPSWAISALAAPFVAQRPSLAFPAAGLLELSGSPYEMGRQHGQAMANEVRTLLKRISELPSPWRPGFAIRSLNDAAPFMRPEELEELAGIADGAGVHVANVLAHNLSLAPDYAAGCTQFAVTARANRGELLHAVNEDAPLALRAPMQLARVVQQRRPRGGIPHVTFSIAGQFGGFNGVNSSGLSVTSTLLLDGPDQRPDATGLVHASVVKTVLEGAHDLESAVERIRSCRRLGAWSMCLSHAASDRLCYLEYDSDQVLVDMSRDRVYSTNHSLLRTCASRVPGHSDHRLTRLKSMLAHQPVTLSDAQVALRDRHDGERGRTTEHATMNTVCRVDNQVSIVMRPAAGEIWATPGPAAGVAADTFFVIATPQPGAEPASLTTAYVTSNSPGAANVTALPRVALAESSASPSTTTVASRFVLRMEPKLAPPHGSETPVFNGAALVIGDNPVASALKAELERSGVSTFSLSVTEDPDAAVAEFDRIWSVGPVMHLFLTTPRDAAAATRLDEEHWRRRQMVGVLTPYFVCQRWMKLLTDAGRLDDASLVATTSLAGDFGFAGEIPNVESGALAGLLKSVVIESWMAGYRTLPIKVIDLPADESPTNVIKAIYRELGVPSYDIEISYVNGERRVVRAIPESLPSARRRPIARGGVWVCTGGARGITAFVAGELAERYGLKLHLLGTAPRPSIPPEWRTMAAADLKRLRGEVTLRARQDQEDPLEAWRDVEKAIEIDATLRSLAQRGIQATYHSCDVSDRQALARALDDVRRIDGPIEGILHGAGIGKDMRFDRKQRRKVEQCVRAKTDGAAALMALTAQDPLKYFVAFGSISGRFGANGHTDYSLANDMLAKQVGWFRGQRPECAAVAFHWHAWGDVGMATKPETKLALELIDMQFMPAREGLEHLIGELEAGAPEGEVLITDYRYYRAFFPAETLPISAGSEASRTIAGRTTAASWPFLADAEIKHVASGLQATVSLHPTKDPFLADHRLGGRPLLPVVIGVELLAEAAALASSRSKVVELCDLDITSAMKFFTDDARLVRAYAAAPIGDRVACRLAADVLTRDGRLVEADRTLLSASFRVADAANIDSAGGSEPWSPPSAASFQAVRYPTPDDIFFVGPSLQRLRKVAFEQGRVWGSIIAPALVELAGPRRQVESWLVPSSLLDACLHATGMLALAQVAPGMSLPRSCRRLLIGRLPQPAEICMFRATLRGAEGREAWFDFTLRGGDGGIVFAAEGYRVAWLSQS